MTRKTSRCSQRCPTIIRIMNTNHALIIVTIVSISIGIDTRIDVVAVICRYIKVGMTVCFPLFLYISLRVSNECE